jgi:hypothetical protein
VYEGRLGAIIVGLVVSPQIAFILLCQLLRRTIRETVRAISTVHPFIVPWENGEQ